MPAANLGTLFDPGPLVQEACKALFEQTPALAEVNIPRGADDLEPERIEVFFTLGQWANRWGVDRDGVLHQNTWGFSLICNVWTKRSAQDPTRHVWIRQQIAQRLEAAVRTPDFLEYHSIPLLKAEGRPEDRESSDDMDSTQLRFGGLITIRSDAWPLTNVIVEDSAGNVAMDDYQMIPTST